MGTSAKRYGIETRGNLELERRLRGIEIALSQLQPANVDAVTTSASRTSVPQVTGLRVTGSTPGAVSVAWNAVSISDLRRYEIQFATTAGFSADLQTYKLPNTSYSFSSASETGGGGGVTWYARVRAVNSIAQTGPYSVTLNLTTGQAQTEDIGDDAVTTDQIDETDSAGGFSVGEINDATIAAIKLTEGLKGRMAGLVVTRPSTSTITVSIGTTSRLEIQLSTAMTKSIASTWVAGSGEGGLGTGAVAADTWYHAFLIKNDTTLVYDVGIDTVLTATNLLTTSGYDRYRLLCSIFTDGSSNIIDFIQHDNVFLWETLPPLSIHEHTPKDYTTPTLHALDYVPLGYRVEALVNILCDTDEAVIYSGEVTSSGAVSDTEIDLINRHPSGSMTGVERILTTTAQEIFIHSSDIDIGVHAQVHGWIDEYLRGAVVADTN